MTARTPNQTGYDKWLAEQLKDPKFRAGYEQGLAEIKADQKRRKGELFVHGSYSVDPDRIDSDPRTSQTDPLQVTWFDIWDRDTEGSRLDYGDRSTVRTMRLKLGITMAPGRQGRSLSGALWDRSLSADVAELEEQRVGAVVCLLESRELIEMGLNLSDGYFAHMKTAGIEVRHFPIWDGHTPGLQMNIVRRVRATIRWIDRQLAKRRNVVVHCAAGLGRSGLLVGCYLVEHGQTPEGALALLEELRGPRCPETQAQREYVMRWRRATR